MSHALELPLLAKNPISNIYNTLVSDSILLRISFRFFCSKRCSNLHCYFEKKIAQHIK